jgi:radical SAM superfamily enzyme YgiQ (UPF0313 family)
MYKTFCNTMGAVSPNAPLGLMTVATLLPNSWDIRLIDRNIQELTFEDIDQAHIVMTGGMLTQQNDTLEIIRMAHARGKPVVVGGPDVSSTPHIYSEAEFRVRGEAESVMEAFLEAWNSGATNGVFEAELADMTRTPIPRYDLIQFRNYLQVAVQFSRGCPFDCEFCDVIELFGHVPRTKTPNQMLTELEALYQLGYRGWVFFVDDNFIGNRKEIRQFLPLLKKWQEERGYPFEFTAQVTVNVADDLALLTLMREASFATVFIGIESADQDTLVATQKKQNARRNLVESIAKIHAAGIFVHAGFIIGFDGEKGSIAETMINYIETTSITFATTGLLLALPNTQLSRRLAREGRLHPNSDLQPNDDEYTAFGAGCGLNFETKRPRRDILVDYVTVLDSLYNPISYFARLRAEARAVKRPTLKTRKELSTTIFELRALARLLQQMLVARPQLAVQFLHTVFDCVSNNPGVLKYVLAFSAAYLDIDQFRSLVVKHVKQKIALIDCGEWKQPRLSVGV